jgi:hypothetical protein
MAITHNGSDGWAQGLTACATGKVGGAAPRAKAQQGKAMVRPGHPRGQIVTLGWMQVTGGPVQPIRPGDGLRLASGQRHSCGAKPACRRAAHAGQTAGWRGGDLQ